MELFYPLNNSVLPPVDLRNAVRLSGLNKFLNLLVPLGLDMVLQAPMDLSPSYTFLTVFGPTDLALGNVSPQQNISLQNDVNALYYLVGVNGNHPFSSFVNDATLPTFSTANVIRTNVYSKPTGNVYTANGVLINSLGNFVATTGILHVMDTVIFPPTQTVLQFIQGDSRFTIFSQVYAPLMANFNPTGFFTLLAPINTAFNAYPNFTSSTNQTLLQIIGNHILTGSFFSAGFFNNQNLVSVNNFPLPITVNGNAITIGNANLLQADIITKDGVVLVIDNALIPAPPTTAPSSSSTSAVVSSSKAPTTGVTTKSDSSRFFLSTFTIFLIFLGLILM